MSQDQLLHISSTCLFLGFWVYAIGLVFYVAHAISPGAEDAPAAFHPAAPTALGGAPSYPLCIR